MQRVNNDQNHPVVQRVNGDQNHPVFDYCLVLNQLRFGRNEPFLQLASALFGPVDSGPADSLVQ